MRSHSMDLRPQGKGLDTWNSPLEKRRGGVISGLTTVSLSYGWTAGPKPASCKRGGEIGAKYWMVQRRKGKVGSGERGKGRSYLLGL